jgi:hypothetical protein
MPASALEVRDGRIRSLFVLAALDKIAALKPTAVVASHKRPENDDNPRIIEETRQYIRDFDRLLKTTSSRRISTRRCSPSTPTG